MALIYHIAQAKDADDAASVGSYHCESLQGEGFIHCCKPDQLAGVIERYYSDVTGLMLLHVETDLLQAKLVYENTMGGEELFPHVYGEINMDSVLKVEPM